MATVFALGWEDFKAIPTHAVVLCVIYPVLGLVLFRLVLGYSVLPLLFPLAAGFTLIEPFAALGLYELSRRRELGEEAAAWDVMRVLRAPSFGAILELGVILLVLFGVWIATADAIYVATFGNAPAASIPDFARRVLTTPEGWSLIIVGFGVGFLFAVVALCVSVISFPLMLDRHATAIDAIRTSIRAVIMNPIEMAVWGLIVAVLLAVGSLPFFVGLAVVLPVLEHATWHLYRKGWSLTRILCRKSLPRQSVTATRQISRPLSSHGAVKSDARLVIRSGGPSCPSRPHSSDT